jgi:hypothetical protein
MNERPNCPECEAVMARAPRPLSPMFGNVHAFECPSCLHILMLKFPRSTEVEQLSTADRCAVDVAE